ncbi:Serine/threonine-protein phosphatase 6 regulatory ankyrin repeat subunit B [Pelomyxa schiedti]|nr:Serine/threonine-protein phosphatase 6 regulatory ankyrin repeat subunit B [Pelomyxa schiedti]
MEATLVTACADGKEALVAQLLGDGAPVNRPPGSPLSPLFAAACEGHAECLRLLLEHPSLEQIDDGDSQGRSPLYAACINGRAPCALLLVSAGANINAGGGGSGGSCLHAAVRSDCLRIANMLLQAAGNSLSDFLSIRDKENKTALHFAIENRSFETAELLLQKGAEPNTVDNQGQTPLQFACKNSMDDMVELLLEHHADPNIKDAQNRTALHLTAANGSIECLELLLRRSFNSLIDPVDIHGFTPVLLACINNRAGALRLLLERGANLNSLDINGRGCVHASAAHGATGVLQFLHGRYAIDLSPLDNNNQSPLHLASVANQAEMVAWLLEKGVKPNGKDKQYGRSPLHWAARLGHVKVVSALVASIVGVEIDLDLHLRTPVHLAALAGHTNCLEVLSKYFNLNSQDKKGCTALFLASSKSHHDFVAKLLQLGADPSIGTSQGHLPLHIAAHKGNYECLQLLSSHSYQQEVLDDKCGRTPLHFAAWSGSLDCFQILTEKNLGNLDKQDTQGHTALHISSYTGNRQLSEWLLSCGAEPDLRDSWGETALFKAAVTGNVDCVRVFIESNANPRLRDNRGHNILHAASYSGDKLCFEYARKLLDPASLVETDADGRTPFHYAVCSLDIDLIEQYTQKLSSLRRQALLNTPCKSKQTALHIAAFLGNIDMCCYLLDQQADPGARDENGVTPLMTAVSKGKRKCAEIILKKFIATLNSVDKLGRTALHWASFYGATDCVSLLLDKHANVNSLDHNAVSPLAMAACTGNVQIVQLLMSKNADTTAVSHTGASILHYACIGGYAPIINALLSAQVDVLARDNLRRTPIHVASHNGHPHICALLISWGSAVNPFDLYRRTPLAYAAANGDALVVKRLLDEGANPNAEDAAGLTPLKIAQSKGHIHCAELLSGKASDFSFLRKTKVCFDFNARDETEISIRVGDIVNVLWEHDSGWWKGELNGNSGLFPSNYCELIPNSSPHANLASPSVMLTSSQSTTSATTSVPSPTAARSQDQPLQNMPSQMRTVPLSKVSQTQQSQAPKISRTASKNPSPTITPATSRMHTPPTSRAFLPPPTAKTASSRLSSRLDTPRVRSPTPPVSRDKVIPRNKPPAPPTSASSQMKSTITPRSSTIPSSTQIHRTSKSAESLHERVAVASPPASPNKPATIITLPSSIKPLPHSDPFERLYADAERKKLLLEEKRRALEQDRECTYSPQINKNSAKMMRPGAPMSVVDRLYTPRS